MGKMYGLTRQEMRRCKLYQYKQKDNSIHARLMKPVWDRLVTYIPQQVCPTLITTLGLVANLIPCILLVNAAPTATEIVPSWMLFWCVLGIFTHQNMDNLDGRQARRFGVETCVGDFFDHGADAITSGITVMYASVALQLGDYPGWVVTFQVVFLCAFYTYHWKVCHSKLATYSFFDVTEAQDVVMVTVLVSAIGGQSIWKSNLGDFRKLIVVLACLGALLKIVENVTIICQCSSAHFNKVHECLKQGFPLMCHVVCWYLACVAHPDLYHHTMLLAATSTVMIGKPTFEIMVVHFVDRQVNVLTLNGAAMAMFCVNSYVEFIEPLLCLQILLIFGLLDLVMYFFGIQQDMHSAMGFRWFQLTRDRNDNASK